MLKSELLESLEKYILDHHLKPGDRLPGEVELASRFGVSRGTIREVIGYLVLKKILERRTSQGTVLCLPKFEEIADDLTFQLKLLNCGREELKSSREILELSIVPSVIRYATPAHIDHLTQINDAMLAKIHDRPAADELDLKFHMALFDITDNRILKLFARIITVQFEGRLRPPFRDAEAVRISAASHRDIIKAIAERDSTALTRMVMEHIKPLPSD